MRRTNYRISWHQETSPNDAPNNHYRARSIAMKMRQPYPRPTIATR
jgi:hypothetical protein